MVKELAIGGLLAGGAILLIRYLRKRAEQEKTGDKCTLARDAANLAQPGSGAAAYAACKAATAIADAIGTDWDRYDEENRRLNGEVEIPLALGVAQRVRSYPERGPALRGTVTRFKNGCVPFEGAPGFEKCAIGTHSMKFSGAIKTRDLDDGDSIDVSWDRAFAQTDGDPFTQGPFTPDGSTTYKVSVGGQTVRAQIPEKFDLPLAAGETGWVAGGRPFTCPQGTRPALDVRDQRGGTPPCTVDGESPWTSSTPPPTTSGNVVSTSLSCNGYEAPAGYTWDAGGFWRRLTLGEAPNPGPCAQPNDPVLTAIGNIGAALSPFGGRLADMQ